MKGYMISPEVKKEIGKLVGKGKLSPAKVDNIMISYILDGDVVEVPMEHEVPMQVCIQKYQEKGWSMLAVPENDMEVSILQQGLAAKGLRMKF